MAGFGEMKNKQITNEEEKKLKDTPASKRTDADPYAALREEYKVLSENRPKTHCFMGIIGHENTGKSAIVLDFFQKHIPAAKITPGKHWFKLVPNEQQFELEWALWYSLPAWAATTFAPPRALRPARTVPVMAAPGFIRTFFWTFLPDFTRTRTSVGAYLSTL